MTRVFEIRETKQQLFTEYCDKVKITLNIFSIGKVTSYMFRGTGRPSYIFEIFTNTSTCLTSYIWH